MASAVINSRADLDAIAGTPQHAAWMAVLAGSLWRLERDDAARTWRAIEDDSTIERFGFTRADFPDALPPALPEYVPPADPVPVSISMRQARLALLDAGLLQPVSAAIAAMPGKEGDAARIEWEYAQSVRRDSPLIANLAAALKLDDEKIDNLFRAAIAL